MLKNILFAYALIGFIGCSSFKQLREKVVTPVKGDKYFYATWGKNLDPSYLSGNVPIHLNGPALYDGNIYIGHSGKGFLSIEERDGAVIWFADEDEDYTSSPVVYGDSIIYGTTSGRIKSRKLINGELNFELDVGASVDGTPVVTSGRLFVQLRNHQIFSLDASTGKILWSYKKSVAKKTTIQGVGKGVVVNNLVIYGFADGDLVAFRVETGDVVWEKPVGKPNSKFMDLNTNIIKLKGVICTSDSVGNLYFINAKTGEIVNQVSSSASTNLVSVGDKIYFGDYQGGLNFIDQNYEVIGLKRVSKHTITRIGLWKNSIVSGDIKGNITSLSLNESNNIHRKHLGNDLSAIFTKPEVGALGGLVLYTSRGRLYYYR